MDRSGRSDPPVSGPSGRPRRITADRRRGGETGAENRRIGNLSLLLPRQRPPASPLSSCLEGLQKEWQQEGRIAALWQAWPAIAGPQLAPHCRPLQLQGDLLTVGAAPGPWLQALQYNRHQLLGALRGAGFSLRDLRFRQVHATPLPPPGSSQEEEVWALHPSRVDVHGLADCPACGRPAPAGEMARWGHCSFCRRQELAEASRASFAAPGALDA
jgi:predicted nucleic acid-binding Zn ribbon protein